MSKYKKLNFYVRWKEMTADDIIQQVLDKFEASSPNSQYNVLNTGMIPDPKPRCCPIIIYEEFSEEEKESWGKFPAKQIRKTLNSLYSKPLVLSCHTIDLRCPEDSPNFEDTSRPQQGHFCTPYTRVNRSSGCFENLCQLTIFVTHAADVRLTAVQSLLVVEAASIAPGLNLEKSERTAPVVGAAPTEPPPLKNTCLSVFIRRCSSRLDWMNNNTVILRHILQEESREIVMFIAGESILSNNGL
ncbi:unnamed protein product [Nesidiocoris tenuis]|uniref:Uncharacterized protein n=1 Tax=Nesidiocoris tenuis TaxID=355587 RepID=A0A6H5HMC5_9HEMI|nr:unnamed protein product [Nesidiocoris tenuis]